MNIGTLIYHRPPRVHDTEAEITFISEDQSGRKTSAYNGYRPDHNLGVEGMLNGANHEYLETESLSLVPRQKPFCGS